MVPIVSDDVIETAFKKLDLTQVEGEITELAKLAEEREPTHVVEIGTAGGGTLYIWASIETVSTLISVDLPGRVVVSSSVEGIPDLSPVKNLAEDKNLVFIRRDSHKEKTLERVREELDGHKLDFLFVDGDHTYEGVKQDFEMYSPLVSKGGIIAFHDICQHPPEKGCEVHRFWQEVKENFRHREIVKNWNQGWAGIGVIFKNSLEVK